MRAAYEGAGPPPRRGRQTVSVPASLPVAAGLLLGYAADSAFGDPARAHPVALYGNAADALQRQLWRDDRAAGVRYVALAVGAPTLLTLVLDARLRRRLGPPGRLLLVAGTTWASLGGRSLAAEGEAMRELLAADDLDGARNRLSHLCSRDATELSIDEIARAAVESIAENTSDAVTGPLLWGALAGPAGIVAYRCANTLDAMVGHRTPRYERFGWAAAKLDDMLNMAPARLTGALTVAVAPLVGGHPHDAWRAWWRDAAKHPSPNAGVVEATAAGALGIRLGGTNRYAGRLQERGELGTGRRAIVEDLPRAGRLARSVANAALVACVAAALGGRRG